MNKPLISVIIPTYNWSAALRCAIRSVLLQSEQRFEVLVVGDHCTDDSEQVVASFNDDRLRWYNLNENHGSQWAANNFALERANADWVAYLGHDDIWFPTHLESILRAGFTSRLDVITSIMILYGPLKTGARGVAGLFPSGRYSKGDFVPPSAVAHRTDLYKNGILWRDARSLSLPMDIAFMDEVRLSGRKFGSTDELTCFKFNAAWRRDVYVEKSVHEQMGILSEIEAGNDIRHRELLKTLECVVSDRFVRIEAPVAVTQPPGWLVERNRRFKGVEPRFALEKRLHLEAPISVDMQEQEMWFEWHEIEKNASRQYRWTGPSTASTIDTPVIFDRPLSVQVIVAGAIEESILRSAKLSVWGRPLETRLTELTGEHMLEAEIVPTPGENGKTLSVTIETDHVVRPIDLSINEDRRWLGLAIGGMLISPRSESASRNISNHPGENR